MWRNNKETVFCVIYLIFFIYCIGSGMYMYKNEKRKNPCIEAREDVKNSVLEIKKLLGI